MAMVCIQSYMEDVLAGISPTVRTCLVVIATAVTAVLVMYVGVSLGKLLYYITH